MLEIKGLNAFYGSSHVLHNIGLSMGEADRVAVLGRNGAGKTTFFKSILNAGPATRGLIAWRGTPLADLPTFMRARLGLSLIPEDRRIFAHLTVLENLELAKDGAPAGRTPLQSGEALRWFPMLGELQRRYGNQLSGGQQQMLAVARGLVPRPYLLLLDEPTEGLAPVIVQGMAAAVKEICAAGKVGLLLSEQNLWFARQCTERLYVLDSGAVVFEGDWATFDANAAIKSRYLAV